MGVSFLVQSAVIITLSIICLLFGHLPSIPPVMNYLVCSVKSLIWPVRTSECSLLALHGSQRALLRLRDQHDLLEYFILFGS